MNFEQLGRSYLGDVAKTYDVERMKLEKWASEQRIVEDLLATVPAGSSVVDIPIGTGRFVEAYHRLHLMPTGMDISSDMITIAARKAQNLGLPMPLHVADIRSIDVADGTFDTAVCICFLNWVDTHGARTALRQLVRVTRRSLIIGIRHYVPFRQLHPATPKGFLQWSLQLAARAHKAANSNTLRVHAETDIIAMFREFGLSLRCREPVVPRKYGTDYCIYMLEKSR
jgi:ubiquinone/menaquinone biosynthesis C-methylase UbiE